MAHFDSVESEAAPAPSSSSSFPPEDGDRTKTNASGGDGSGDPPHSPADNTHTLHLLLHEVLPYLRLGVQENQLVISPPLALVATSPALRIHCEEEAPYALAGTWWLAHTTTHCLVRCRIPVAAGANKDVLCTSSNINAEEEDDDGGGDVPAEVERVFTWPAADNQPGAESVCWVLEEARRRTRDGPSSSPSSSATMGTEEPFMARKSGVMALIPPQLSSNRRLLSFVPNVPACFLSFCSLAAQHGWQSAARTLLQHLLSEERSRDACEVERRRDSPNSKSSSSGLAGPVRLYVVHTQLYAICGFTEGRLAHSAWWVLRRTASAMGPTSLPTHHTSISTEGRRLSYHPAALAGAAGCVSGQHAPRKFVAATEGAALRAYHSSAQLRSLRAALRTLPVRGWSSSSSSSSSSNGSGPGDTMGLVTNAASLIVSGDLTFWSAASSIDMSRLLQRHWHPFFRPLHEERCPPNSPSAAEASSVPCEEGGPLQLPPPPPPPCALFLHGNVVLAVEHKLHRDAMHARQIKHPPPLPKKHHGEVNPSLLSALDACVEEDDTGEEEEEVADVRPIFFDMGDDDDDNNAGDGNNSTAANNGVTRPLSTQLGDAGAANPAAGSKDCVCVRGVAFHPEKERFLGEISHHHAFQLLHCVDVTYLRLPLGPELVAERPAHRQGDCNTLNEEEEEVAEVWDARWLWCLFPRVQVLDVDGPPSFSYASSGHAVVAAARRYRPSVRPRELALTLGAAAAAQIRTVPLRTIDGLWRLTELRHVVLRAYPFQVLPALVVTPLSLRRSAPSIALSVMGWPHVDRTGLHNVAHVNATGSAEDRHHDGDASRRELSADDAVNGVRGRAAASTTADAAPAFTMLSFTHMDSLAFVDALQDVFPATTPSHLGAPPTWMLRLHHLTQLELAKTRVTTAALRRMRLPTHTPHLQVLRLSTTPVESVRSLLGLCELRVLNLSNTHVTRRGLRHVQWMPALEELFLTQCERLGAAEPDLCAASNRAEEEEEEEEGEEGAPGELNSAEDGATPFSNIFSLGNSPPPAPRVNGARGGDVGCVDRPFPSLRVLDLSNNPLLTEQALRYTHGDGALCVEVRRYREPCTQARGTDNSNCCCSRGSEDDRPPVRSPWFAAQPRCAPMPQLDTLFLMHTSVASLACLLAMCPNLRCLDVSFTALREEGLWAHVLCPRQLPLWTTRESRSSSDNMDVVFTTHFPTPLRLQQLNLSGTLLSSLHPLSEAPPLDWAYTTLPATAKPSDVTEPSSSRGEMNECIDDIDSRSRFSVTAGQARSANRQQHTYHNATAVDRGGASLHLRERTPTTTTTDTTTLPELLFYAHPSILEDRRFDVHLRTQAVWTQHVRHHGRALRRNAALSNRLECAAWSPSCNAVRVPSAAGYTVAVDAAHWVSSTTGSCSTGVLDSDFNTSTQWTAYTPVHDASAGSVVASDGDMGGVVRYGVVDLSCVQQLRLGHSRITASGLAAGYGMPRLHTGEGEGDGVGLVELSLRAAPFLCPPYSAAALQGGEVPPEVTMVLHAQLRRAAPAGQLAADPTAASGRTSPVVATAPATTTTTTVDAAVQWTEAEALCAVLRRHRESLRVLDLSGTSVALTTFFDCVFKPTGQATVLHSQWEDTLTQGSWSDAAPALTALLVDPQRVLDSRVLPLTCPALPNNSSNNNNKRRVSHRLPWSVLALSQLQVCDVEDTPLSTALKRLFPRLYHCVGAAQAHLNGDGDNRAVVEDEDQRSSSGGSSSRSDEDAAGDDVPATASSSRVTDDAPRGATPSRHRRGTVQMRAAWEALLHDLFGEMCSVRY